MDTRIQNGVENIYARGMKNTASFLKSVLAHLTTLFPYLYWGTVGSSMRQEFASGGSRISAAVFPLGFWLRTSTFSSLVIYIVGRGKTFLPQRIEPFLHRLSGILLMSGGVLLIARIVRGSF